LPVFWDGEDIASYLVRFEHVACRLGVSPATYTVQLGSLLTGKAVSIYTSLSPEVTRDYEALKKALLRGFNKTPDQYRMDFRSSKIKVGETYQQFSIYIGRLFDQWLEYRNIEKSYESIREFMIFDQLISSLSSDIRMFIKERNTSSLDAAVELPDTWASAHNAYPKINSG